MRKIHLAKGSTPVLAGALMLLVAFGSQFGTTLRAAQAQTASATTAAGNVEQGRQLATKACVQCHGPQHYVIQRKSAEGWRRTVYDMLTRGSPLLAEEIEPVVTYLTATYGPNSPIPRSNAAPLPDEAGRAILMANCTQCHAVEMVRAAKKTEAEWLQTIDRMVTNGAKIGAADKPVLAKYAAAHLGQ
jgi:mono/diheme cytochrome c family protein